MPFHNFSHRHNAPDDMQVNAMLKAIGVNSVNELIEKIVPSQIRLQNNLDIPAALSEFEYLKELKETSLKNKNFRSYIGLGYYNTITPGVILRNIFENPGWYTAYTPYQAEIAQGRMEALLNYQTMVCDLTGMQIANASLLDEGTAAAEAMSMFFHTRSKDAEKRNANKFFVADDCFPQTIDILLTRSKPLGIELVIGNAKTFTATDSFFGALLQYPSKNGEINNYKNFCEQAHALQIRVCVAADIMSLVLLTPPGEWGADCVVGTSQRFGVPMGYGGPHAAFFATHEEFKRDIPGRIIGMSLDAAGKPALRMALQTREQHIRREKATSNICTAQVLLAVMASMYAVYHGKEGLTAIANDIHTSTTNLAAGITKAGYKLKHDNYFDTICVEVKDAKAIEQIALLHEINFRYDGSTVCISVDETTTDADIKEVIGIFAEANGIKAKSNGVDATYEKGNNSIPKELKRTSDFLHNAVFNTHHSEHEMLRYIKRLENKDLSMVHSMISLGSCTMKLNATSEMIPLSWSHFNSIHPFAPIEQAKGYAQIISELELYLGKITGFAGVSLQPNSGAQGEYAGLMVIHKYHEDKGQAHRNICLIPQSAHGTNPASAVMAGLKVVVVKCDENGNIDVADLRAKAEQYKENLSCLMVTYPSTHGVYEEAIKEITQIIHDNGGQVYMDGANMNAQVGLTSPAKIGADVCHLNLHKTFAIPHGGGGPGMGPICVNEKLAPFLPGHPLFKTGGINAIRAINAAPFGSASILLISYAYIKMLGGEGCTNATKMAILNANYLKSNLEKHYDILYVSKSGRVAHEFIIDFRKWKHTIGLEVEDVAKRLMDYGFHAPTVSFPVAGTLMIEPTESESKEELDRFIEAMVAIKAEIAAIENGDADKVDNTLKNAPHTMRDILSESWNHGYSREQAVYPVSYLKDRKFWPSVARINNTQGDRNLICTCPPIESYMEV